MRMVKPATFYVVVDLEEKIIWFGRSMYFCAKNWQPDTFWGRGETVSRAYMAARNYAAKRRESRVNDCPATTLLIRSG